MEQMSWPEFGARLEKNPVVFLPCGATEQHGPHLPLAVDALLAQPFVADAAEAVGGIVAPTLNLLQSCRGRAVVRSFRTSQPRRLQPSARGVAI